MIINEEKDIIKQPSLIIAYIEEYGFKDLGEISQNFNVFFNRNKNYYIFAKTQGTYNGFSIIYSENEKEDILKLHSISDDISPHFKPNTIKQLKAILNSLV